MNKTFLLLSIFVSFFISSAGWAALLGPAQDYNVFVFDMIDVNNSDSSGRIAAGGAIDLEYYGVGGGADTSDYSIVSGGNVDIYSGMVSNGGIFAASNIYLDHHSIYGDVTANGAINLGSGGGTISGTTSAYTGASSPVDFGAAYTYLTATSDTLRNMPVNGATLVKWTTNITFTGTESVNIFSLSGSDLNNANVINFNIGINDIAVINVSGVTGDHFTSLGIIGTYQQSNILWNFYEAVDLDINTTVQGSILAPHADVTFDNGNLWGTLVANSMTGTGEFHYPTFNPDVPVVPEPVSTTLFVAGGAALGLRSFRRDRAGR